MTFKEISIKPLIGKLLIHTACTVYFNKDKTVFHHLRYRLFVVFLRLLGFSLFPVVSISRYKELFHSVEINEIVPSRTGYTGNIITETDEEAILIPWPLPSLNQSVFHNVAIQGHSDIVVDIGNGTAINDMCYNLEDRVVFYDNLIYRLSSNVCILRRTFKNLATIKAGIMISGKFSNNYFHTILENLIRLLYIKEVPQEVPIIVDKAVLTIPSLKTILDLLCKNSGRDIISIGDTPFLVETLYTLDRPNHIVPHVILPQINLKQEDFVYDAEALIALRNRLLPFRTKHRFYSRIFISRNNSQRRHFNEDEVFAVLEKLGFVKVAPEQYSFYEQMALFNDAEFIVGGSGAAFTNFIFCQEGCHIICLQRSIHEKTHVFAPIAYINHCRIRYYGEDIIDFDGSDIHKDFYINAANLEIVVKQELKHLTSDSMAFGGVITGK